MSDKNWCSLQGPNQDTCNGGNNTCCRSGRLHQDIPQNAEVQTQIRHRETRVAVTLRF